MSDCDSTATTPKERYWAKKYAEAPEVACACGCGGTTKSVDHYARPATYINGHNARKYEGVDATRWAVQKRWKANNPDKVRDGKRAFYRKRKLHAMALLGNLCCRCGLAYDGRNAPVFEFHHRDPDEKDSGVTRWLCNRSWEQVQRELLKCDLVCANCHNQHHGSEW